MTTTIEYIKQLREITGAGVFDCRQAMEDNNYCYEAALADLKELAARKAAHSANRETVQGIVDMYSHNDGRIGVMLEVNCETDFAAKSARFRMFVHELALHITSAAPLWVADADIPQQVLEQESSRAAARARAENKPEALILRICEGTLMKFMDRHVLLRQPSLRDETVTVAQWLAQVSGAVGENIVIRRFIRWELAEGMRKEE
jgi:elongation factor Ts